MSYKILKVIFVILLLVTIGEAGFYVYILKQGKNPQKMVQSGNNPSTLIPQVTQTNLPTTQPLISSDTITYLQNMKYVKNKKIVVTIEESGYVDTIQIQPKGKATEITLVDENGTRVSSIARNLEFWNNNLYKKMIDGDVSFSITDVKKRDIIMHTYQMDLTNNTETHKYEVISK